MSIEDHRRRLNGSAESTGQLSVAELIARREAETMPIPVITDDITPEAFEPTIKFKSVRTPDPKHPGSKPRKQTAGELHITELLRREGRADDTQSGGFTVGKLAAAASGGVVLCGSVAFGASSWLSTPDERPLAQVRFDERAQARGASAGTEGVVKLPSNKTQQADETETASADPTTEQVRVAPYTQQPTQQKRPAQPQTQTQQPTQQPSQSPTASTPSSETQTTPTAPSTTPSTSTPAPPTSSSTATPPSSTTPPPSSTENPLPTPSNPVDVSIDLGVLDPVLNTVGETVDDTVGVFDFFAPAE
ncbi:hypothetical protein BBK82_18090 [Lentzea guizhouensis]|uniref:Uncharacterized protein n=1 Tax=Lentzea guizhouensis TaxID=1586287 RepID=A0A1B2HIZ0_9PSEU|nr:hypothetical protein [Lentzea guizhouensis]ANZ37680.1 hypothetical protein BBK82_18090 [Lentzea guizhouensis]